MSIQISRNTIAEKNEKNIGYGFEPPDIFYQKIKCMRIPIEVG